MKRAPQKLGEYHRKRSPAATNEPFGDEAPVEEQAKGTLSGAYVVHLHDATRRHYDLRLEVGGVLASFAVPRGPSLDPDEKGLAVKTEDHPIEYLEFEDVIPAKQYGAGPMIAWDRGTVEYLEGPAEEEIARGKLDLMLRGLKLRGRYAVVKLKKSESSQRERSDRRDRNKGDEWLLFKKKDEHSSKERNIIEELPRSVLSGLTVEELENKDAIGRALEKDARAIGKPLRAGAEPSSLVAISSDKPRGNAFIYDADLEGIRVLASREGDVVTLQSFDAGGSPRARSIEAFYPDVVRALRALPVTRFVVEGNLVAFDAQGHPSMKLLAERAARISRDPANPATLHRATTTTPATLVVADLLSLGDIDVRAAAIEKRRALLARLLPPIGFLRAAPTLEGDLARVLESCAALGLPGVVAKKKGAPYEGPWLHVSSGAPRARVTVDHSARDANAALRKVTISNRAKVFWPDEGLTKGDLCDFYSAIADTILPYLADRPVILVRYPDGIEGKNFYQWNVPPGMPPWVRTISFTGEDDEPKRGFLVDDASTLLYMANLACIPVHILACRVPDLARADFFTVDFDIKQSELRHAITLARTLKELLDEIGLPGFPKTSGQSGLHVLCPLGKGQNFATACALADLLGKLLVERHPDIATMERIVKRRGPKVYVDTGQTGESRAIVAPYSVRAVRGARVSTPLTWSEVTPKLDVSRFTMKTVPARLAKLGDPMRDMLKAEPDVPRAVERLSALVASARSAR